MIIPTGLQYQALDTDLLWLEKHCNHCGHSHDAQVLAQGVGIGDAPLFLFRDQAKADARNRAATAALDHARASLALVRCPSCHRRSRQALAILTMTEGFIGLLIGFVAFFAAMPIGMLIASAFDHAESKMGFIVARAVTTGLLVATARGRVAVKRAIKQAELYVEFKARPAENSSGGR